MSDARDYYERRGAEHDDACLGAGTYAGRDWPSFEEELGKVEGLLCALLALAFALRARVERELART